MISFRDFTEKYSVNESRELTPEQEREFDSHKKMASSIPHTEDHRHSYAKTLGKYHTLSFIHTKKIKNLHDHLQKQGYRLSSEKNVFGDETHVYSHPNKPGEKITVEKSPSSSGYHEVELNSPISKGKPTIKDKNASAKRKQTEHMKKVGMFDPPMYD